VISSLKLKAWRISGGVGGSLLAVYCGLFVYAGIAVQEKGKVVGSGILFMLSVFAVPGIIFGLATLKDR
jgi:hypothetical protein